MNTANLLLQPAAPDPTLQALHVAALRCGTLREVLRVGDAESALWEAPSRRIIRRAFRDGRLRSEIHVLLGESHEPLAWWQRCSGAHAAGPDAPWPWRIPHVLLVAVDGRLHDLGVDAVFEEIAALSGRDTGRHRAALSRSLVPVLSSSPVVPFSTSARSFP